MTALLVMCRPAMPMSPPLKKPPVEPEGAPWVVLPPDRTAPPMACPPALAIIVTPRAAIMASAIREPPVRPTLMPKVPRMLSIFCDTFKKDTAQKN